MMDYNQKSDQRNLYNKPTSDPNQNYGAPEVLQSPYYQNQIPAYQNIPSQLYQQVAPPQIYPQVQYSQPVIIPPPITTTAVIINQPVLHQKVQFRTAPLNTFCPFCKAPIVTFMKEETNMRAWCCCICTCGILFACLQMANNKEMACNDYIHICPQCGSTLGRYYAM